MILKKRTIENNIHQWDLTNPWYKRISKKNIYIWSPDNNEFSRLDLIKIIKLRLGHTKITHDFIMDKSVTVIITAILILNIYFHNALYLNIIESNLLEILILYLCFPLQINIPLNKLFYF